MNTIATYGHQPWNKGKLVGEKAPLRIRDIWAIRVRLQLAEKTRDLALFNLAIDSSLRACDLTKLCTLLLTSQQCKRVSSEPVAGLNNRGWNSTRMESSLWGMSDRSGTIRRC